MLTRTTETALRALLYMTTEAQNRVAGFQEIAEALGGSSTYLKKVLGLLVKSGLLRSMRGTSGGVTLARPPEEISLLQVVEACQGILTADFCSAQGVKTPCSFHQAMSELHTATMGVLSRWTLASLSHSPMTIGEGSTCKMLLNSGRTAI